MAMQMQIYDLTIELIHVYREIWGSKRINEICWNFQINVKGSGATLEGSKAFISKIELYAPSTKGWNTGQDEASDVGYKNSTLETPPWEVSLQFFTKLDYDVKGDLISYTKILFSLGTIFFRDNTKLEFLHPILQPPPDFKVDLYMGSSSPPSNIFKTIYKHQASIPIRKSPNTDYTFVRSQRSRYDYSNTEFKLKMTTQTGNPTIVKRVTVNGEKASNTSCELLSPGVYSIRITLPRQGNYLDNFKKI
jgi:hypothetical protein